MNTKKMPKQLKVVASYAISPHMQRLEFTTDDIQYFAADSAGQYLKLMFTPSGGTDLSLLGPDEVPILRTYTIRQIDVANKRLAIDFVKHHVLAVPSLISPATGGYGHYFAERAQVGDPIAVRGPGVIQPIDLNKDWLLLVADMTSLPALSVLIQTLPADARGFLVLEVLSTADIPVLRLPANVELSPVVRGQGESLSARVARLPWLAGQPAVWCACEFSDMRAIRSYVTDEHELDRAGCYFSSYWKVGVTEDGHKVFKQQDKDSLAQ